MKLRKLRFYLTNISCLTNLFLRKHLFTWHKVINITPFSFLCQHTPSLFLPLYSHPFSFLSLILFFFFFFDGLVATTMAVELMTGYNRSQSFTTKAEENAVQEAASGLESVEKLIKLLSEARHKYQPSSPSNPNSNNNNPTMDIERDCKAVADIAVSKFKRVISLLEKTRTGHARFRKAPLPPPPSSSSQTLQVQPSEPMIFNATPLQQIPPTVSTLHRPIIKRNDSSKTLNFSYSGGNSFISSLTGDDNKQPSMSSPAGAFQITNLSHVSSVGKPPLSSSSLKRKCSSETLGSGKCGSSSSRCHCSKKRYVKVKCSYFT